VSFSAASNRADERGAFMNISKFEAFVKVVEQGSLTKAAVMLGYTQSGVSHIISDLEEEFGFALLFRSRAGVRLTADGERVLPVIRSILNSNERLNEIIASVHGLDSGTVRIGTFTSVAVHWLPGMIKEFLDAHPNIDIKLMNGDYHDVEQWINEGAVDLGFVVLPTPLDCECVPLIEDKLLAVLPPEHSLAKLQRFPVEEFEHEPYISLLENSDQDARSALEKAGVRRNIKFVTKDDYAIIAMVEQGLGVSIMPELLLKGYKNIKALELSIPSSRTIALAIPEASKASPASCSFSNHICRWVEKNKAD
jgi:DNA-binding transcriptional LysR family regulator